MDAFEKGDIVRILPCGHVFHKEECDEWLMKWRKLVRFIYLSFFSVYVYEQREQRELKANMG